jgi:hypothetical protein
VSIDKLSRNFIGARSIYPEFGQRCALATTHSPLLTSCREEVEGPLQLRMWPRMRHAQNAPHTHESGEVECAVASAVPRRDEAGARGRPRLGLPRASLPAEACECATVCDSDGGAAGR